MPSYQSSTLDHKINHSPARCLSNRGLWCVECKPATRQVACPCIAGLVSHQHAESSVRDLVSSHIKHKLQSIVLRFLMLISKEQQPPILIKTGLA